MRLATLMIPLCLSISALAGSLDLTRAPQPFAYGGGQAVYVDFTEASYDVSYDAVARTAVVKSRIRFLAESAGNPLYDLVGEPTEVRLDGERVADAAISTPDNATRLRVLQAAVSPGEHTLEITHNLTALLEWSAEGVKSAFWTSDLRDRGYLEQYLPTNMEYDRVPMTLNLEFVGGSKNQVVYANGVISDLGNNKFSVRFPEYFTASSLYFHTVPVGSVLETRFSYRSMDGRELPVVIYLKPGLFGGSEGTLAQLRSRTEQILAELEGDYGPFLHPSVTIYNSGSGGMEYCGATITSASALAHELTHSYFARGLIPANGNAGWIDEALASWRDGGYQRITSISGGANMAGRAAYTRYTDRAAYTYGARFMSYLDGKFADQGGLKPLLRKLVAERAFTPYFTEDFVQWAAEHFRADVATEFRLRVYGNALGEEMKRVEGEEHPIHRKLGQAELRELL